MSPGAILPLVLSRCFAADESHRRLHRTLAPRHSSPHRDFALLLPHPSLLRRISYDSLNLRSALTCGMPSRALDQLDLHPHRARPRPQMNVANGRLRPPFWLAAEQWLSNWVAQDGTDGQNGRDRSTSVHSGGLASGGGPARVCSPLHQSQLHAGEHLCVRPGDGDRRMEHSGRATTRGPFQDAHLQIPRDLVRFARAFGGCQRRSCVGRSPPSSSRVPRGGARADCRRRLQNRHHAPAWGGSLTRWCP